MSHVILVFICCALKGRSFCYADMNTDSVPGFESSKKHPTNSGI